MTTSDSSDQSYTRVSRLSHLDGGFYSLMVGFGETYVVALALFLGIADRNAAALGIVPVAIGSILQLWISRLSVKVSPRIWVVACAVLQALGLSACALSVWAGEWVMTLLYGAVTLYWTAGQAAGPTWNAWLGQVIETRKQKGFFLHRNSVAQACTFAALLISAVFFSQANKFGTNQIFVGLFLTAALCRLASAYCLYRHPDPDRDPDEYVVGIDSLGKWLRNPYVRHGMVFTLITSASVHISAPFFTPYMLNVLKLDYMGYVGLLSAALISRMMIGKAMGVLVRRDARPMFLVGVVGIIALPQLWVFSDDYFYLCFLQILSGVAWGCHEMGMTLYLLDKVPHRERSRLLTWNHVAASLGMMIGVGIGWSMTDTAHLARHTYEQIFLVSTLARILPIYFVFRFIHSLQGGMIPFRTLGVRPGLNILRPLLIFTKRNGTSTECQADPQGPVPPTPTRKTG